MRRSRLPAYKKKTARYELAIALEIEAFCEANDLSYSQVARKAILEFMRVYEQNNNPTINNLTDELRVREIGF